MFSTKFITLFIEMVVFSVFGLIAGDTTTYTVHG
jgi:hypothetical protein